MAIWSNNVCLVYNYRFISIFRYFSDTGIGGVYPRLQPELGAALVGRGHPLTHPNFHVLFPWAHRPLWFQVLAFISAWSVHRIRRRPCEFCFQFARTTQFDDGVLLRVTEAIRPTLPPVLSLESSLSEQVLGSWSSSSAFGSLWETILDQIRLIPAFRS